MDCTSYNRRLWLEPLWATREVCGETVLFVGEEDEAPLLYRPREIVSVRSYGLDTEYVRGRDYIVTETGKIKRPAGSKIPFFREDEYYRKEPDSIPVRVRSVGGRYAFNEERYLKYGEGDAFTSKQIAVCYTHDGRWRGAVPKGKSERFPLLLKRLKEGRGATVLFYGDSITAGCNSSGTEYGGNTAPYAEPWPVMVAEYLKEKFAAPVGYINTAVGGKNTEWGLENLESRVLSHYPDLAVIAFGMNDAGLTVEKYKSLVSGMIDGIRARLPDCEILLVSTTVPNVESDWFDGMQKEYVAGLRELEADEKYSSFVALADMTTMHLDLLSAGKRFRDMTGNNINHPNDFLARFYAQTILKTILGDDFGR